MNIEGLTAREARVYAAGYNDGAEMMRGSLCKTVSGFVGDNPVTKLPTKAALQVIAAAFAEVEIPEVTVQAAPEIVARGGKQ